MFSHISFSSSNFSIITFTFLLGFSSSSELLAMLLDCFMLKRDFFGLIMGVCWTSSMAFLGESWPLVFSKLLPPRLIIEDTFWSFLRSPRGSTESPLSPSFSDCTFLQKSPFSVKKILPLMVLYELFRNIRHFSRKH